MNKIYLLILILLSVTGIVSEPITGIITGGFGTANIDGVINLNNTNFTITFDILDETDLRAPGDSISEGFQAVNVVWTFSGHTQTFVEDANQTIYIENDNGNGNNLILGLTSNIGDRGFISVSEGGGGTGAELLLDQAFPFGNLGALGNDLILAGTIENLFPSIQGSGLGTSLKITSFSESFTFNIQPLNTVPEPQYYALLALLAVIWRFTSLHKKKIQKS